jgi:hypothetical protein
MEDAMCYTRDYKHFEEQQKKADTKIQARAPIRVDQYDAG